MNSKTIGESTLFKVPTKEELEALKTAPNAQLLMGVNTLTGTSLQKDILPILKDPNNPLSNILLGYFSFCNFLAHQGKTILSIHNVGNNFKTSAFKITNERGDTTPVTSHLFKVTVKTNDGSMNDKPFIEKVYQVNITDSIVKAVKDELKALGLTVTGTSWGDFTATGKQARIKIEPATESTVLIGSRDEGFLIS